jgi:hypothetical protein
MPHSLPRGIRVPGPGAITCDCDEIDCRCVCVGLSGCEAGELWMSAYCWNGSRTGQTYRVQNDWQERSKRNGNDQKTDVRHKEHVCARSGEHLNESSGIPSHIRLPGSASSKSVDGDVPFAVIECWCVFREGEQEEVHRHAHCSKISVCFRSAFGHWTMTYCLWPLLLR